MTTLLTTRLDSLNSISCLLWCSLRLMTYFSFFKNPTKAFDIQHYVEFCSGPTRSSTSFKLKHSISFYKQLLSQQISSTTELTCNWHEQVLFSEAWNVFISTFDPDQPCSYHFLCPFSHLPICNFEYLWFLLLLCSTSGCWFYGPTDHQCSKHFCIIHKSHPSPLSLLHCKA